MKSGDKRKSHLNSLGKYLSKWTKLKLLNNLGEQNSRLQIDQSVINIKVAIRRKLSSYLFQDCKLTSVGKTFHKNYFKKRDGREHFPFWNYPNFEMHFPFHTAKPLSVIKLTIRSDMTCIAILFLRISAGRKRSLIVHFRNTYRNK